MFKYNRHELVGIAKNTLPNMFAPYCKNIKCFYLRAYCDNVYEDISCPKQFRLGKADYTIGTIGRTNKQYVQPMVDSILNFVSKHRNLTFNILYVGGSMDKQSERKVIKRLSSAPNANLVFTGMIFPLSVEMIRQMDVCIASAGLCSVSHNCGIPTISIDGNDSKAIGIFNRTTNNTLFRGHDEPPIEIERLLGDVLINKMYPKTNTIELINVDFSTHWDFIAKMAPNHAFYDIERINSSFSRKIISIILGYYYGLSPRSFSYHFIKRVIQCFHN